MQQPKRDGSEEDVTKLNEVFSTLNFNVFTNRNLSKQDTLKAVHDAANEMKRRPGKYLVYCIMTHGNKYDQLATFSDWLSLDEILAECSDIIGKNQIIFIIQACRSNDVKLEKLVVTESTDYACDAKFYSDVLVARSTYPETVSMRNGYGSYFIQEVCHTLKHLRGEMNLFKVLTVVNYRMAYFFKTCIKGKEGGQMPIFESTLTSEILFDAINSCTEPDGESLLDWRIKGFGVEKSPDLNCISNLKYDFTREAVKFFGIRIKHKESKVLKEAAASLRMVLKKPYPDIKPVEVSKMWEVMKNIEKSAKEKADCVFYLISGPSSYGSLCDTKGKKINQRNVIERFVENQNPHLVSKPKIFLFLMFESVLEPSSLVEFKESGESCDGDDSCFIAQHADILQINIVVKSKDENDIYAPVNAMIQQLEASNDSQDFLSILTKVNHVLYKDKFLNNENNFCFYSTLTQELVLPK